MRQNPLLIAIASSLVGSLFTGWANAAQVQLDGQTFTLPDGYTIERVAGPGLTDRPIHADFDHQGRLYVAESSGSNLPVQKQLELKPHSILRLEDTDGDGVFDKRTVFADKMMFPEGVLWHGGSVYVCAPPEIWKLTDTNDDGVADEREVWFNPGTLTGCANDLHGPVLGRDGWIYWSKGAFAEQHLDLVDGGKFVTRAAHIFRRRPGGGGVEPVMTGGMDNPVESVQTLEGDRFFTSTFMRHPGGGMRDGIGFAAYGALFGKDHDVVNDHPRTSPTLNDPIVHLGPAATAGLCYSESDAFGDDHRGNLYAALFNLHKVTRHVLIPEGSGYRTTNEDFVFSDNLDFHPTDVFEDADGSLIVINTGGWYKICCPTSQLYKPDVLGAIYRIRKTGMPKVDDPRGLKLAWAGISNADLAKRLEDHRPYVRQRTIAALAIQGGEAVSAIKNLLASTKSDDARVSAVWALSRIDSKDARELTRSEIKNANATVSRAALYSSALWRDHQAASQWKYIIKHGKPAQQRLAAEGLGRVRDGSAVSVLIEAMHQADPILTQALTRALIDIGNADSVRTIASAVKSVPLGALIALDQLNAAKPGDVLAMLSSTDEQARATADWIVRRHNDWGVALTDYFETQLGKLNQQDDNLAGLIGQMATYRSIQDWLAKTLAVEQLSPAARITTLEAMGQAGLKAVPDVWKTQAGHQLADGSAPEIKLAALKAVGSFSIKADQDLELQRAIRNVAADEAQSVELRMTALGVLPEPFAGDHRSDLFDLAVTHLGADQSVVVRQTAARVIGSQSLSIDQRQAVLKTFSKLGPMELNRVLDGFAKPIDDPTDAETLKALGEAGAFHSISVDKLRNVFAKYPESAKPTVQKLIGQLDEGFGEKEKHIDELLAELKGGDVIRGQAVFNSPKAVCSSCHAIGYLGGDVGPDLTRVGQIRSERDILEAIVYPSASFVRSFEPVRVLTKDGEDYNGVVKEDATDHLLLATGPGATVRVARANISEMLPGSVSIMPAGLDQVLTKTELADLLAFLKATRW